MQHNALTVGAVLLGVVLVVARAEIKTGGTKFVDRTAESKVNFEHRNSATSRKYLIETMSGGAAIFDYDSDGWLDLFFVNGARLADPQSDGAALDKSAPEFWNRLYRNNRDGTFADVTEAAKLQGRGYGMGAAAADYDNDGDQDLCVTNYGEVVLYRNDGRAGFADVTRRAKIDAEGWTTGAGFFDYDNDGDLDLFVGRYLQWNFAAGALFCGEQRPGGRAYCHPDKFPAISNYLFRNNGDGTFADVSAASRVAESRGKALGVAFADFDGDELTDVAVANDSHPQFLFRNNGDGTFAEVGAMAGVGYTEDGRTFAGMGTDFADLDGDNYPDIVTTALPYEYYSFFRNNRDGTFSYLSLDSGLGEITRPLSGWGVRIFDYDNDGGRDLFLANGHVLDNVEVTQPHLSSRQKPLLLKFAGGKFTDVSPTAGDVFRRSWNSRGAAFGDLDNDGDTDVVVANCGGPAYLIRNDGGNTNHWIGLKLRARTGNRDGIGAKATLTHKDGRTQTIRVTTAGGYLSSHDPRILFGLGDDRSVRKITVRWPDGAVREIVDPAVDRYIDVEQTVAKKDAP